MKKILYLSCHSILEYDEVKLLHELGYEIFSPGAYINPEDPGEVSMRPGILGLIYKPNILTQFHKIGSEHPGKDAKDYLTKEFVDNFDIVIVMHLPRWIKNNWEVMKHKRVIWRTIGQSVASTEDEIRPYRAQGLEIVRYSPMEATTPGYVGKDKLIRFYKDPNDYGPWNGKKERVISFAQSMQSRGSACNYPLFEEATRPFNRHLFGPGNEGQDWTTGKVPFEQLKQEMRDNRVYFYTGTHPASYTLNFMEAWMTGIPIVAIGPKHGNASYFPGHELYEIPSLITNGIDGFVTDNVQELQTCIKRLLEDKFLAERISFSARQKAISIFGKETVKQQWKDYL